MDKDSDIKPIIISAVIIANIIMNTLTIAVMLKYPVLREDCSALFMFSLTLSDLAMGCISMPISAAVCSRATPTVRHMTTYLPEVQLLCIGWFTVNSLYSLCWMTVSKMVALLKPLHYEQILSRKRCYGIIAFNWLFGVAVAATKLNNGALWNMHSCTLALPARGDAVSVLAIIVNGVSIVVPSIVLIYATVRIVRVGYTHSSGHRFSGERRRRPRHRNRRWTRHVKGASLRQKRHHHLSDDVAANAANPRGHVDGSLRQGVTIDGSSPLYRHVALAL